MALNARQTPRFWLAVGLTLAFLIGLGSLEWKLRADDRGKLELDGLWKIVVEDAGSGDTDQMIVEIRPEGDQFRAEVIGAPLAFTRAYVETSRDALVLLGTNGYMDLVFKTRLNRKEQADPISGMLRIHHPQAPFRTLLRARLERTEVRALAPKKEQPENQEGDQGGMGLLLGQLGMASEWESPSYQPLDLRVAHAVTRDLPLDAVTEEHLWAAKRLSEAVRKTGPPEQVKDAETKLAEWQRKHAEEKQPWTGTLKPRSRKFPRAAGDDRVVLLELFTGAECGPCIAADQATDALDEELDSSELLVLQYHLHIPAPDPLANPDSVMRARYYDVRSTPSTFFNGRAFARSGGPSDHTLKKYNQYQRVVESLSRGSKLATISLKSHRKGEEIYIRARAEILKDQPGSRPKLHIALVENQVSYDGGNGLKNHRRVVRALPGGADGYELENDRGNVECILRLKEIRSGLESYVDEYPRTPDARGNFPRTLPPIEFQRCSVVAFVQTDGDKEVLHVVEAPITDEPIQKTPE